MIAQSGGARASTLAALPLLILLQAVAPARAQSGTVEEIIVVGNRRMTEASFRQAFGIREGDSFDPVALQSAFRKLWDLGLFEDITIEAEDAPNGGKAVIVKVVERPILSSVSYEDNKVLTRTQIEDRLTEREIDLKIGRPIDLRAIFEAEGAIRDYLGEKGFLTPQVWHEIREVTATSDAAHFFIRPGSKTRIKKIEFKGNEVFSDRRLRKELKLTQQSKWYWPWSQKSLYHPIKWDQDVGAVRDLYQALGYLDVDIKPPVVEVIGGADSADSGTADGPKKKKKKKQPKTPPGEPTPRQIQAVAKARQELDRAQQALDQARARTMPEGLTPEQQDKWNRKYQKSIIDGNKKVDKKRTKLAKAERKAQGATGKHWVKLTVPLTEGLQYRTGEITVEGNTVYDSLQLRALIPLREGGILSNSLLKSGIGNITRLYEDRGYLYANVVRRIERHQDEPVADVRVQVDEDKPYTVKTIEFSGNTATKDNVLRRELLLNESDLFSRTRLDTSVAKVNQLGYYQVVQDPVVEPLDSENAVRVTVAGQEQGRNEIQVGGGYSGVDGAFFTGFYSTRNFLGRGQTLALSMQIGGRTSQFSISFVEPWFMNRPWTAGFSLFRRDTEFGLDLSSRGQGGGVVFGRRLTPFSSIRFNYNYEEVTSTGVSIATESTNVISSVTPSYAFNRILFPRRPTSGWSFELQVQMAGGIFGGNTNFLKPVLRYTTYHRMFKRFVFGFHAEGGLARDFQGRTTANTTTVEGVPRFTRFWLGGDTLGPRVFETRTITPLRFVKLDAFGRILPLDQGGAIRDPTSDCGGPCTVGDYDRNNDGVLNVLDLVGLGGDRFYLFQTELVYPISEQFDVAFFWDVGNALFEDQSIEFGNILEGVRTSAGIEMRFHLPVFPVPLRLIYGWPLRRSEFDSTSHFTFSIGKSF